MNDFILFIEQNALNALYNIQYTINGKDEFLTDTKTQDAVIRNTEI
jgi:hypothetical protein